MWVDTGYRYFGGKACIVHDQTILNVALALCDLLQRGATPTLSRERYNISRGQLQALLKSAAMFSSSDGWSSRSLFGWHGS